jgi:hypothetical protein
MMAGHGGAEAFRDLDNPDAYTGISVTRHPKHAKAAILDAPKAERKPTRARASSNNFSF